VLNFKVCFEVYTTNGFLDGRAWVLNFRDEVELVKEWLDHPSHRAAKIDRRKLSAFSWKFRLSNF